jgi:hypothetical protein
METNLTKYQKDIDTLIERGAKLYDGLIYELRDDLGDTYKQIPKSRRAEMEKCEFKREYNSWYNESIALIKQLIPERLDDFQSYYKREKRKEITYETYTISDYLIGYQTSRFGEVIVSRTYAIYKYEQQYYIVRSLKDRFASSLYEIRQLLQADVFDSEIDAAKELCKKGFYRAAGAICGVVLEKHLFEVSVQHQIKVTKKHPAINDLNELLKSNNVIEIPVWRNIQRLADIRNMCDHHKGVEPSQDNIEELMAGTDKILKTVF